MNRLVEIAFLIGLSWACIGCSDTPEDPPGNQRNDFGGFADAGVDAGLPAGSCYAHFVYRHHGSGGPTNVSLAGSFEEPAWSGMTVMEGPNEAGEWRTRIGLFPGAYQYKVVVDDNWRPDPENPAQSPDGFDGFNSVLEHVCPNEPLCVVNSDCIGVELPNCRNFQCVPCTCPGELGCHPRTGRCIDGRPCEQTSDCLDGQVCRSQVCAPCMTNDECGEEESCRSGRCTNTSCESHEDCNLLNETCQEGHCTERECATQVFIFDPGQTEYERVFVSGNFVDWRPEGEPMTRLDDGRWLSRFDLADGLWHYKFVGYEPGAVEPVWLTDPANPDREDDGFGGFNSLRPVACANTALPRPGQCGNAETFEWRDSVMYFAMIDRFYDSDGIVDPVDGVTAGDPTIGPSGQYAGGDLAGVTAKLPYLLELGVTSIWLSAPYDNRDIAGEAIDPNSDSHVYSGYHGYWPSPRATDYSDPENPNPLPLVESRVGDADDLHELVNAAHEVGMKVLFDYVMNHVDIESELYQAHPEWFASEDGRFRNCGRENLWEDDFWGTRCAFTDYLPPFEFESSDPARAVHADAARAWSVADAIWWAKEFEIDGYRLDAIKHVPIKWLTDLRDGLDAEFEEPAGGRFYLVGETFDYDNIGNLARFVDPAEMLDGQFDFPMKARLCEGIFKGNLQNLQGWMDDTNNGAYGPGALMTTWIGNHDIPRAIHFADDDGWLHTDGHLNCRAGSGPDAGWNWRPAQPESGRPYQFLGLAFGVMMTNPGIPLIYYGDEIGLAGGGDPDNRRMMPSDEAALNPHQLALRQQITDLTRVRRENRALSRGRRTTISADHDTWKFRMSCDDDPSAEVIVAINRGDDPRTLRGIPFGRYTDLSTGEEADAESMLPPRSILILKRHP